MKIEKVAALQAYSGSWLHKELLTELIELDFPKLDDLAQI